MDMNSTPPTAPPRRGKLGALVAGGLLLGGAAAGVIGASAATAGSATSGSAASSSSAPSGGASGAANGTHGASGETLVTGTKEATLRAAALKAVPGATVDRVETDSGDGAYEVHLTKADGTRVTVTFDSALKRTAVEDGMGEGPGGASSGQGHGGPGSGADRPNGSGGSGPDA